MLGQASGTWVMGKTREQLLLDLKYFLGRLRDDPRSISDRLRVAAIQLRLGRIDEALIHYEGVLGGAIACGQLESAAILCRRLLHSFEHLPRIEAILRRVEQQLRSSPPDQATLPSGTPVRPTPAVPTLDESDFVAALLGDDDPWKDDTGTLRSEVGDRLFSEAEPAGSHPERDEALTSEITARWMPLGRAGDDFDPGSFFLSNADLASDGQPVVLLTRRK